ncbi:MAG: sigma-70 family RNA polymerase sigma factor [Planctomycetes bacterium]|nr:sigma-70 family RNA polymerase sigma factor [Planctomycetota bacterium]
MEQPCPEVQADRALVAAALRGELPAIEELAYRLRCVPRIVSAWNVRLGRPLDAHDLEDLAQDVTVVVLRKLGDYAGRAPFEAWVCRICRLELLNGVRRKLRRRVAIDVATDELPAVAGPESDAAIADAELLHGALERVGGVEAEMIRIKHFEGLTFEEIGARLGLSANTAKTRYYRGMVRLESILAARREPHDEGGRA